MIRTKILVIACALAFVARGSFAQGNITPFILQDEAKLADYKRLYQKGDKNARKQIDSLMAQANRTLASGPYSVTFQKLKLPPGGDKHDYVSQAPYWWPDSSKAGGKPYIRRDGRINPERNLYKDRGQMGDMASDVKRLALAYYFSGNEVFAKKAVQLMKAWFIDPATRMNPNLNYAQFIPGINDGRGIGIIETVALTNIPDALAMMKQSKELNGDFIAGIKQWYRQFTDWLLNSPNGKDERSQKNNHGTYYDLQVADFALFTTDTSLAQKVIKEQTIPRINEQFGADGSEPLELVRTKSWGYSVMNLVGWCKLAVVADRVNIDLWHIATPEGKSIRKVFEWLTPYMLKEKTWEHEQIEPFTYNEIIGAYMLANTRYAGAFPKVLNRYPETKEETPWW